MSDGNRIHELINGVSEAYEPLIQEARAKGDTETFERLVKARDGALAGIQGIVESSKLSFK